MLHLFVIYIFYTVKSYLRKITFICYFSKFIIGFMYLSFLKYPVLCLVSYLYPCNIAFHPCIFLVKTIFHIYLHCMKAHKHMYVYFDFFNLDILVISCSGIFRIRLITLCLFWVSHISSSVLCVSIYR